MIEGYAGAPEPRYVTPARRFAPAGVTARRLSIRLLTALVAALLARSNKRIDRQK